MANKSFDALRILEIAKDVERKGMAFYKEAAETVADKNAKAMLLSLADDETRHLEKLEEIRSGLAKAFPALSLEADVANLASRFKERLFPDPPSSILSDTSKSAEINVLERGIKLEDESIKLYEDATEQQVSPGASSAFRRLVMEERMHLFILNQRRDLLKL